MRSRTRGRPIAVTGLLAALTAATTVAAGSDRTPARAASGPLPAVSFGAQRTVPAGDGPIALGTGGLRSATSAPVGRAPSSIAVADLNRDRSSDLVVGNRDSGDVSVLLGTGTGGFVRAPDVVAGKGPRAVAIADLDADGTNDLAVANNDDGTVLVLLGTGTGSFMAAATLRVGASPRSIAVLDVDRDGRKDLAVANLDSDDVSVLLNTSERRGAAVAHRPRG